MNKASAVAEEFEALISRGSRLHADSQYLQAWEAFCAAALLNPGEATVLGRTWNMTTTVKNFDAFLNFLDENAATLSAGNLDYYAALALERLGDKPAAMKRAQLSVNKFPKDYAALLEAWRKKSKASKTSRKGMLSMRLSGGNGQADLPLQSVVEELAETVRWRESFVRARVAQEIDALGRAQEFASREQLHKHAIDHCSVGTLVLEFGVASGTSLRFFGREMPEYRLFGFDSFEGLPEAWEHKDAGTFNQDALPQVETNTKLVVGWSTKRCQIS